VARSGREDGAIAGASWESSVAVVTVASDIRSDLAGSSGVAVVPSVAEVEGVGSAGAVTTAAERLSAMVLRWRGGREVPGSFVPAAAAGSVTPGLALLSMSGLNVAADLVAAAAGLFEGKTTSPSLKGKLSQLRRLMVLAKKKRAPTTSARLKGFMYPHSDPSPIVIGNVRYQIGDSTAPATVRATRPTEVRMSSTAVASAVDTDGAVTASPVDVAVVATASIPTAAACGAECTKAEISVATAAGRWTAKTSVRAASELALTGVADTRPSVITAAVAAAPTVPYREQINPVMTLLPPSRSASPQQIPATRPIRDAVTKQLGSKLPRKR